MFVHGRALRGLAAAATLGLSVSACHYVKQDDLEARLTGLRQDLSKQMDDGDQQVSQRVDEVDAKVARLQADLNQLKQDYDVKIQQLESSLRFDMPVYFQFDKSDLQPQGREVLQKFSQIAQKYYPDALVTVEGFTDPSGSKAYNQKLGMRRADAVKSFLVTQGMSGEHVRAVSYGEETQRLVSPDSKGPGNAGWQNRRVVMVIDHASETQGAMASASNR